MIVIDSNVLVSALIKDSKTRQLILEYNGLFLFPSYIFEELQKHKEELRKKSKMEGFETLLAILLKKVEIVPEERLKAHKKEAVELAKNIDLNDAVFFACALTHPGSIIWSDDKKLKNQNRIKIMNTTEMIEYFTK